MAKNRNPNGTLIYIGSFKVESGSLHISDPCYEDIQLGITIDNVDNGEWHAFVRHRKEDSWFTQGDERVGELLAFHNYGRSRDREGNALEPQWELMGIAGVDSGQMSILDKQFYRDDKEADGRSLERFKPLEEGPGEKFYSACGCLTLPPILWSEAMVMGGVLPHGAVSPSGYGDGAYNVYAAKKVFRGIGSEHEFSSKEISSVRIVFIGDEEEEEEVQS